MGHDSRFHALRERLPAPLRRMEPSPWWFLPPLLVGAAIVLFSIVFAPQTPRSDAEPKPLKVRYITLEANPVRPVYSAFGRVRPLSRWQSVAQVAGRVVWRHPQLQPGARFERGEKLLQIQRDDYAAARSEARSRVAAAQAALAELDTRAQELQRSLEIARRALTLSESDYERNVELAEQGHISAVRLNAEEQALLRQRQRVQDLSGQLKAVPAQRRAAKAREAEARSALSRASRDLERTAITMPFEGRIERVEVEQGQFVPLGQTMVVAEGIRDMEVMLEAPYGRLTARFPALLGKGGEAGPYEDLQALVRHPSGGTVEGRVTRIDPGLNAANRGARVYISVDGDAGRRPLPANLYLEVEVRGPALHERLVIPRLALHQGNVLLAGPDDKLEIRPVTVAFEQEDSAVVSDGLRPGERVILTDVLFPVNGMPLAPIPAENVSR